MYALFAGSCADHPFTTLCKNCLVTDYTLAMHPSNKLKQNRNFCIILTSFPTILGAIRMDTVSYAMFPISDLNLENSNRFQGEWDAMCQLNDF